MINESHACLVPEILRLLDSVEWMGPRRVFDLGCGEGGIAAQLAEHGYDVTGVDPSGESLEKARQAAPGLKFFIGSCYDDLAGRYGRFQVVLAVEVVEHVLSPAKFAACVFSLLEDEGMAIITTPYHGYLKNLAISVVNGWDAHFTALWEGGHIKFWSARTLRELLLGAGFSHVRFRRCGRIPPLAKSLVVTARRNG